MAIPLQVLEARLAHAVAAVRRLLASESPEVDPPVALAGLAAELHRVLRRFDLVVGAPHDAAGAAPAPPAHFEAELARVWQQAETLGSLLTARSRRSGAARPADVAAATQHLALVCGRAPTAAAARPVVRPIGEPHGLAAARSADDASKLPEACFLALAQAAVLLKHAGFDR